METCPKASARPWACRIWFARMRRRRCWRKRAGIVEGILIVVPVVAVVVVVMLKIVEVVAAQRNEESPI